MQFLIFAVLCHISPLHPVFWVSHRCHLPAHNYLISITAKNHQSAPWTRANVSNSCYLLILKYPSKQALTLIINFFSDAKKKEPHIKKPLNAFMIYMKDMRPVVQAECTLKRISCHKPAFGSPGWALLGGQSNLFFITDWKEGVPILFFCSPWFTNCHYNVMSKLEVIARSLLDFCPLISPQLHLIRCLGVYMSVFVGVFTILMMI